ncbi:MAG: diacylglycerol kinase [Alphaproteobacteria bacterium]|nr:MAG: diacylglycerol kinase [Alphaproteobacteria bacterium]
MANETQPRKLTGMAHFMAASGYSAGGLSRAWKEAAFRQEVGAGAGLAFVYGILDVGVPVTVAAAVLFLTLIAVEALNTAIEEIVDRISPEISTTARHAKDLGSFAVLCLIAANVVLLCSVLYLKVMG